MVIDSHKNLVPVGGKYLKKFHISDVLTVITGKMVSIRNMEGLYDILNYMSNDNLHTHQLVRVIEECEPYLKQQFPQLEKIDISGIDDNNLIVRIKEIEKEHGSYLEVKPLPEGVHAYINPIAELLMIKK